MYKEDSEQNNQVVHYCREKGSLMDQILSADGRNMSTGLCGGRGVCGKCKVRFLQGAPLPSSSDRKYFTPKQLRQGYRLACLAKPLTDCRVELHFEETGEKRPQILTHIGQMGIGDGNKKEFSPKNRFFSAVDIGTTTVAMLLIDRYSQTVSATHTFLNPQRRYGIDVVSRIQAAGLGKALQLKECLERQVLEGFEKLEETALFDEVIFTGNTAMAHLFLGYPAASLGEAPFIPHHIEASRFRLRDKKCYFMPGISAFVGADILAGIYAFDVDRTQKNTLYLDLGTNGEMVFAAGDRLLCTAAAAGSAFEEASRGKELGTDLIQILASLLEQGILDDTGLLAEPWFTEGIETGGIWITQKKIRDIQLTKAAICTGIVLLKQRSGISGEDGIRVLLSGGFGYDISPAAAVRIGLLPGGMEKRCQPVGNGALAGVIRLGLSGIMDSEDWLKEEKRLEEIACRAEVFNLAEQSEFDEEYVKYLEF